MAVVVVVVMVVVGVAVVGVAVVVGKVDQTQRLPIQQTVIMKQNWKMKMNEIFRLGFR